MLECREPRWRIGRGGYSFDRMRIGQLRWVEGDIWQAVISVITDRDVDPNGLKPMREMLAVPWYYHWHTLSAGLFLSLNLCYFLLSLIVDHVFISSLYELHILLENFMRWNLSTSDAYKDNMRWTLLTNWSLRKHWEAPRFQTRRLSRFLNTNSSTRYL